MLFLSNTAVLVRMRMFFGGSYVGLHWRGYL